MEPLTKQQRERIFRDYQESQDYINDILSGKSVNCWVKSPSQYLSPTVLMQATPLEDSRSELRHYQIIRNVLEKVLAGESPESTEQFRKAPGYIKERLAQ